MRLLLLFAFAAIAYGGAIAPKEVDLQPMSEKIDAYLQKLFERNLAEIDLSDDDDDDDDENELNAFNNDDDDVDDEDDNNDEADDSVQPRFIISWKVRRFIRKMQKQMPCGWEKYGIPPLAPLKKREAKIHLKKGILETFDEAYKFRIDGLDNFKIKKFTLNIIKSKITFDFLFKNIHTSAEHYKTDTLVDALRQLGVSVQYEGDGTLDFGLVNLRISGVLRYHIPVLWGSIKITSLKTQVSLEKCESNINGFLGSGSLNRLFNQKIEEAVLSGINDNQQEISDKIESTIVPKVNKQLKGNDFWTLLDYILSSNENEDDPIVVKCVPPADPWA